MATINLGSIKFNWKGDYAAGTAYAIDDVVNSSGTSYVCVAASTGNAPPNATYWNVMAQGGSDGSDGTDVGTTLTTQGDILYRDGSGLQRLAKGTASQELRMNSGATAPEWHTPAVATSDYVKVATSTLGSDANTITIDYCFTSTYNTYDLVISKYHTDQTGTNSQMRMYLRDGASGSGSDASLSYSSVYDYAYGNFDTGSQTRGGSKVYTTAGFYPLNTWDAPNGAFSYVNMRILHNTGQPFIMGGLSGGKQASSSGGTHYAQYNNYISTGTITKNSTMTGLKIASVGGNIKAGCTMTIYGIK